MAFVLALSCNTSIAETLQEFTVEVERSLTVNQEVTRILAMLDAKFAALDKIADYLKAETEIGQLELAKDTERYVAFILTCSKDTSETWTKENLTLIYHTTTKLDFLQYIVRNLKKPDSRPDRNFTLDGFYQVFATLNDSSQTPDSLNQIIADYYTYNWMEEAKFASLNNDPERQIETLTNAIQLKPKWGNLYRWRASAYSQIETYDLALNDCETSIQLEPDNSASYKARAEIYNRLTLYDKALADYEKAVELDSENAGIYRSIGYIYKNQNKSDKALENFNRAIELDPEDYYSYNAKGHLFMMEKKFDDALETFDKCIELEPDNASGYSMKANIYLQYLNNYDLAIKEYTKALELETREKQLGLLYTNRGIAHLFNDEPERAKPDLEKAVELGEERAKQFLRQIP